MRRMLLVTTLLALAPAASWAETIKPGQSLTDASGNIWLITPSGSIMENGHYTPGGGGTSALTIGADGAVYGQDDGHGPVNPGGWFGLSGNGQFWTPGPAPADVAGQTAPPAPSPGQTGSPAPTLPTQQVHVTQGPCGFGVSSGSFHVAGGQIIGPDGRAFIARGVNLYEEETGQVDQMLATFKGTNFIRLNIHTYKDPSTYQAFVQQMAAKGIVVEFEDHPDAGGGQDPAFTGTKLAAELAWYASMAKAFASNPYVWFGTFNEPGTQGGDGSVSRWQRQTYDAIRGTGNNNPILLEIVGWPGAWNNAMDPSVYATMTNTIWDTHYYGWVSRYSTDQATVDKALADLIAQVQQITSADGTMPALIGEYGDSTDGRKRDANGTQAVTSVITAGAHGQHGSAAWHWNTGNPANEDKLMNGNAPSAPFGQMVQLYIGTTTQTCTAEQTAQNAQNNLTEITQQITPSSPNETAPAADTPPATAPTTDPSLQAQLDQADRLVAQATTLLQSLQGHSP